MSANLAASVRARLLNLAKAEQSDFNQVLVRFALERILYRLSQSPFADQFLLKGALLFTLWYDQPHRPTRDADLLGFGSSDLESLRQTFAQIAGIEVNDGIIFQSGSVHIEAIRKEAGYGGARVLIDGELAKARCKTQIDIGFGDAVTPEPLHAMYPVLLADLPAPALRTYPVYTVISEKVHAIALLGMANTRLKDYLDLAVLFERETLDSQILLSALQATFKRRGLAFPATLPAGLTSEFSEDPARQAMWRSFLRKNELPAMSLPAVVATLATRLQPLLGTMRA
ncbi:MAG: nucleotidyl transferase AbiEii/AbiGii toxin family protein [Pseudomonadota bacterium]